MLHYIPVIPNLAVATIRSVLDRFGHGGKMTISKTTPKIVCIKPKSIRWCMYETKAHGCSNTSCEYCIDTSRLSLDGLAMLKERLNTNQAIDKTIRCEDTVACSNWDSVNTSNACDTCKYQCVSDVCRICQQDREEQLRELGTIAPTDSYYKATVQYVSMDTPENTSCSVWDNENRFSKTHYETISRALLHVRDNQVTESVASGSNAEHSIPEYCVLTYHESIVHHLIGIFKRDNPNFNSDRFWYRSTGKSVDKSICNTCLHKHFTDDTNWECDLHNSVIDCYDYVDNAIVNTACSDWDTVNSTILRQTLPHPVNGYWDGGTKQVFEWCIDQASTGTDAKGTFVRIGSWSVNHWFNVAQGKTDKITLCNAIKHLRVTQLGKQSKFEYITE